MKTMLTFLHRICVKLFPVFLMLGLQRNSVHLIKTGLVPFLYGGEWTHIFMDYRQLRSDTVLFCRYARTFRRDIGLLLPSVTSFPSHGDSYVFSLIYHSGISLILCHFSAFLYITTPRMEADTTIFRLCRFLRMKFVKKCLIHTHFR
jgi:hypothetical protein